MHRATTQPRRRRSTAGVGNRMTAEHRQIGQLKYGLANLFVAVGKNRESILQCSTQNLCFCVLLFSQKMIPIIGAV
jgi:hypothetical protein